MQKNTSTPSSGKKVAALLLAAVSYALWVPGYLDAQGFQTGQLTGTVQDSEGDPLPGVTVTVTSPALQGERAGHTGTNGDYVIRGLPPGAYKVIFRLEGMATVERTATVELGLTTRSDARMELAEIGESIVVTGEASSALENTQVGANLTAETVDSLPIGRTPMEIAELAPGLTDNTPNQGQVTIAGGYAYDSVFLVDGVDINDNIFGTPVAGALPLDQGLFIEDAIDQTQVLTSAISAEYGRFTGGVVNVITRSGGNVLRGSLRIDFSNPSWRDETPLETQAGEARESNRKEVLTATLGGPILEDRLWYFVAARDTEASDPSIFAVTGAPRPSDFDDQRMEVKLTASPNDRHTLQATYLYSDTSTTGPSFDFSIGAETIETFKIPADLLVIRWGGILSANLFAEAQLSQKSQGFRGGGGTSRNLVDSPFITLSQELAHYNSPYFDNNDPEDRDNQQLAASLSYFLSTSSAGSHDLKFGFEQFTNTNRGGNSQSSTEFVFLADYLTDDAGNAILDAQGRLQPVFAPFGALALNYRPVRGAQLDMETTSLYVNDRWTLNEHWSFNLGFRYEEVSGEATGDPQTVDANALVPRLAASYDPKGDGKYRLGLSYAEYSGMYNCAQFCAVTNVGFPDEIDYLYFGPPGAGVDFAPGFDLDNYFPIAAFIGTANTFLESGLSTAVSEELAFSVGVALPKGGFVEAVLTDRSLTGIVDDTITIDNGKTEVQAPGGTFLLDNIVYRNSRLAQRVYRALQVQGRYRITSDWSVDGHWTYQLDNDGNFEGEVPNFPTARSPLDNHPEILVNARSAPRGRLSHFQQHKLRLWTTYRLGLDRAGDLDFGLLYRFDSARVYSLVAEFAPLADAQLANDPGYAQPPFFQDIFFGRRGSESFEGSHAFDLAVSYSIGAWKSLEPWIKLDVRNVLNDQTRIAWDTTVNPDFDGSVDEHGIWTEFQRGPNFGEARSPEDFVTPREYRVSLGLRF